MTMIIIIVLYFQDFIPNKEIYMSIINQLKNNSYILQPPTRKQQKIYKYFHYDFKVHLNDFN